ncbi:MAG: helix-turn-helix transcriptional regulator, partial [bacterium]
NSDIIHHNTTKSHLIKEILYFTYKMMFKINSIIFLFFCFPDSSAANIYNEVNGEIIIEAESWCSADTNGWRIDCAYKNASGGSYIISHGIFERRDKVTYVINVKNPDTFYVFMRTWASNPGDNGVFLNLDGRIPDNHFSNDIYFYKKNRWDWRCKNQCTGPGCHEDTPYFIIKKPGKHILTLSVKELNAKIDKIILKKEDIQPVDKILAASEDQKPASTQETQTLKKNNKENLTFKILFFSVLVLLLILSFLITKNILKYKKEKREKAPNLKKHSETVQSILDYIRTNYASEITLPDAARKAGLSENYFGKIFRDAAGKKFVNYLNDFRMDKAVELIKTTSKNVSEIHHAVGVHHSSYFAKIFKQKTGISPSEAIRKFRT